MNRTQVPAAGARRHAPFCGDRRGHTGECTSGPVTVVAAGERVVFWLTGRPGEPGSVAMDGLTRVDGRLTGAEADALAEALRSLAVRL